jgi:hypothetical protein
MVRYSLIAGYLIAAFVKLHAQPVTRYAVVIDEIFADPSPPVRLPAGEFIELKNISGNPINLRNWRLSDGNSDAIINVSFVLEPDSFVIVCAPAMGTLFAVFGSTIGVSNFPSLNNDEDVISLYSPDGNLVHAVGYSSQWYKNDVKMDGGWSLEMIDTKNACAGAGNWIASRDTEGGTPGKVNSVNGINSDELSPMLVRSFALNKREIVAVFDEALDSSSASRVLNYQLLPAGNTIVSAVALPPLFNQVLIGCSRELEEQRAYDLSVMNLTDCAGNRVGIFNTVKTGVFSTAYPFDIVINEILFNPKADGYDYVEIYNRGQRNIDCMQLLLAGRNNTGELINKKAVINQPFFIYPGEYVVLTENKKWLLQNYAVKYPDRVIEMPGLPSLPDDRGNIVIVSNSGTIIDELRYEQQWHFGLISEREGIALERINYDARTQEAGNWTSAASTAGFGTPGYQNSQFGAHLQGAGIMYISPKIISPDNDGRDDYAIINYQLPEAGYVATMSVFDAAGRRVRWLLRNATLGVQGSLRWDGLNDQLQVVPRGIYIIHAEFFNLAGKVRRVKEVIVVAK